MSGTAQTILYQAFEVDSAAEPRGGTAFFTTFIQANLCKPITAEAQGIGGLVIVTGVVETDGHVSNVRIIKSLRPDCDREAVRVFSLYNAWKPALKDGKTVRQTVNMPISFKPNSPFTYKDAVRISYFDAANKPIADSSQAVYKQLIPIDTSGLPTGDVVLYKLSGTVWKKDFQLPLVRKKERTHFMPSQPFQLLGYLSANDLWEGMLFTLDKEGKRINQTYYHNGKQYGPSISYHPNGAVAQKTDDFEDRTNSTFWYPNGQIKQVSSETKVNYSTHDSTGTYMKLNSPVRVMGFWTSDGRQLVKDGNGQFIDKGETASRSDTTKQTRFTEQGQYKNGFKQGIWTIRYADNSYYYEEEYDDGYFQKGKSYLVRSDTLRYTQYDLMPEFQGGVKGLQKFLKDNLHYPVNAQRARIQGMVFVSFFVHADGSLSDYEIVRSVNPDLDQEAIRVVKRMSGRWVSRLPGRQNAHVKFNLPINFRLQ
ncbi:TonB family protein [Spirosoma sp. KNUC1025]|uniref:TonB family protein n=1 Tax=Spirosoma sp. KNUC1025 TaxID=2894082 RepID=UPI003868041E|nr:TonB family protein [Spirosoma sp. KNUC1025]